MKNESGTGPYNADNELADTGSKNSRKQSQNRTAASSKAGRKGGNAKATKGKPFAGVSGTLWPVAELRDVREREEVREGEEVSASKGFYYMPVDQLRAQVFLAHGLIYPSAYDKAGTATGFDDLQRLSSADLLLFQTPQPIKRNQLLLKVLLAPEEVTDCKGTFGPLKFPMPLPISRLVGIGVSSAVESVENYVQGWIKPDVPVPTHLFYKVDRSLALDDDQELSDITVSDEPPIQDVNLSIVKFNRYLGLLAYMRNAERYFTQSTLAYADYPELYFSICSELLDDKSIERNSKSRLLSALLDFETEVPSALKQIVSLVESNDAYIEKEKARKVAADIYTACRKNELGQAFNDLFSDDYRSAIQRLNQPTMPPEAAIFAVLYKYSNRQSNDYLNLKQRLHEDWPLSTQLVEALGVLGAYYGYTALPARETKLYSIYPQFVPYVAGKPAIKFHLDSCIERLIVEAAYQRAFYHHPLSDTIKKLYSDLGAQKVTVPVPSAPKGKMFIDKSYSVHDLEVSRYEVSDEGKLIFRLLNFKAEFLDESSEVGRYLFYFCFPYAKDRQHLWTSGQEVMKYKIPKQVVVDLISQGKIDVNPRILQIAMEEDSRGQRT